MLNQNHSLEDATSNGTDPVTSHSPAQAHIQYPARRKEKDITHYTPCQRCRMTCLKS